MPDYISREAAKTIIERLRDKCGNDEMAFALNWASRLIRDTPAADVVEVRKASWVWNPDGMDWGIGAWMCGECKSRPDTWWNTVQERHPLRCSGSHYCGNCGAKMDGGQDNV